MKNKLVLPTLRALGHDDGDFNYGRKTGRGYVDVLVERFPRNRRYLGDDRDTTGVITGAIAGIRCGLDAIPSAWRAKLERGDDLEKLFWAFVASGPAKWNES